jgi:hypothetical protein
MKSSILGSEQTLHNIECLPYSQQSRRIIRTTADYFLVPYTQPSLVKKKHE